MLRPPPALLQYLSPWTHIVPHSSTVRRPENTLPLSSAQDPAAGHPRKKNAARGRWMQRTLEPDIATIAQGGGVSAARSASYDRVSVHPRCLSSSTATREGAKRLIDTSARPRAYDETASSDIRVTLDVERGYSSTPAPVASDPVASPLSHEGSVNRRRNAWVLCLRGF